MTTVDPDARIRELEADNQHLRRLLSHTDATKELRHRLNGTLAMLRVIIRQSTVTPRDIETYVAHVEDRMNAVARAQGTIDVAGEIEIGTMFAEELLQCGAHEGKRLDLSGPVFFLQPRAGQVLTLAARELAANALEHGALAADGGHIAVSWTSRKTETGDELELVWTESFGGVSHRPRAEGFGHHVLMQMLPYELDAAATFDITADGVRYVLRVPITERIGREETRAEA